MDLEIWLEMWNGQRFSTLPSFHNPDFAPEMGEWSVQMGTVSCKTQIPSVLSRIDECEEWLGR